ncbi:MAG: sugar phosphate isomerase/epimerase family protein [Balneolales bacterium]
MTKRKSKTKPKTTMCKNNSSYFSAITGLLLLSAISISCAPQVENTSVESIQLEIPNEYKVGGFAVGPQAYTFNRFTVMEAIENAARMGGRIIELYPGQRLSPENPDTKFDHNSSDEIIAEVKAKLKEHDIIAVNYGVVGLPNNEEETRKVFDFAKTMGVKAVTSEPAMETMDLLEKMVKEYDIALAIHNHPPRPNNPDYKVWDPNYVLSMVEGRDPRVGACADIGHWIRSDIKPIDGLKILEGRLISLHMTDVDQFGSEGEDVIMGNGVGDMVAVLDELVRQNFGGHITIEYEANWNDNVPDASQNVGFIRGYTATKGLN